MKILTAEFVKSVVKLSDLPKDHFPEIAFVGRSNVGKSSLLNALLKKRLAYTSGTPGKTREINYFIINQKIYFVDLPGYGYAKVSKNQKDAWQSLLEGYLEQRPQLKLVLLLIDSRHPTLENDKEMQSYLAFYGRRYGLVRTKIDKLKKKSERESSRESSQLFFSDFEFMIDVSSEKGEGILELLKQISKFVS